MFLFKHKNGKYYVIYSLENGKRKTVSTGTPYKGEAHKFLSQLKNKLEYEKSQVVTPIKIKEFAFHYLRQREPYFTYKTIKTYQTTFKLLEKYFGNIELSDLTKNKMEEYFHFRVKDSSIYAARRDMINTSAAFNYAVNNKFLLENPCKGIKRFKLPEKQPLFYSMEDFHKLVDAIEDQDLKDLVIFAANTGMRQMELITLEWRQINFIENYLTLDNQVVVTKSKRIRTIPLNKACIEILKRRYENSNFDYQNVFTLFNAPIDQHWLSKNFKANIIRAGLNRKLNFHSLRHSHASWLVQAGVSIYVVSKLLGHADIKTTEIYAHLRRDDLRNAVNYLDKVV